MSYADGQYPTCDHEAHVTREDLEGWWLRVGGSPAHAHLDAPAPIQGAKKGWRGQTAHTTRQLTAAETALD